MSTPTPTVITPNTIIKPGLLALNLIKLKRIEQKAMKTIENHNRMFEEHTKIIQKHDGLLKTLVSQSSLTTKLEVFKSDLLAILDQKLGSFMSKVHLELENKVDHALLSTVVSDKL